LLNDCYLSNIALFLNPSRKEAIMAEAKTTTTAQKAAPKTTAAPKKTAAAKPAAAPAKVAAAKPAAAPKKAAVAKPAAAKKAPAAKSAAPKKLKPGPEELYRMVQTAAYFIAERNGFAGDSQAYWAEAEIQINSILK
jgi:hypothetical protein